MQKIKTGNGSSLSFTSGAEKFSIRLFQFQCVHCSVPIFETTLSVLQESLLAIVPLAIIVWFVARTVPRSGVLSWVVRWIFVVGVIPPFGLFLLAELLGSELVRDLAWAFLDGEVRLTVQILAVIDSLIATVLRAFVQFVAGLVPTNLLASFMSTLPSWNPFVALSIAGSLLVVWIVHFVTGVVVVRLTQREDGLSVADKWLTVAGVVLFVSGMVWTLLQSDSLDFSRFELQIAVLASSMGVISGVAASNLPVDLPAWRSDNMRDDPESGSETGTPQRISELYRLRGAIRSLFRR
ncbi:hypothetical protein Htur_4619 (plasmid) [Haloterrigena turkmenica DSM 5511]|uniref:Uncharacterized protein n=1 Tax=Haloterrigena turkmenica (strain ATCC 51198 / DSM 5511 / JCM 9101 / NCIMB 13204 / VKM B-1734 / 4k) TaxID=543526 RepID=D2S208_HALTV|nr:hypothetical protein [Haloterrigena turkmenica]ADB63405.1 hypothetical protein Htur_4619 [Haloterrigena turkmenica DSM 5511]